MKRKAKIPYTKPLLLEVQVVAVEVPFLGDSLGEGFNRGGILTQEQDVENINFESTSDYNYIWD